MIVKWKHEVCKHARKLRLLLVLRHAVKSHNNIDSQGVLTSSDVPWLSLCADDRAAAKVRIALPFFRVQSETQRFSGAVSACINSRSGIEV